MLKRKNLILAFILFAGAFGLFWFRPQSVDEPFLLISTGERTRVESIAFSPNGKQLACGVSTWSKQFLSGSDVQLRDAKTGQLLQNFSIQNSGYGPPVDFSPDGKTLAVGGGEIKLWDLKTNQLKSFTSNTPFGYWVYSSPDGKTLATGVENITVPKNSVKLWDASTGKLLHTLLGHTERVTAAAFSPDGLTILTASYDNTVKLWSTKMGALQRTLTGEQGHMMFVATFSPDGKTIASGDGMKIRLWNAQTGILLNTIEPANRVFSLTFSPDGKTLANAGPLFHKTWGKTRGPHGKLLVSREKISAGEIHLWDVKTGKFLRKFSSGHWALETLFSPDGKKLVNISDDDTIRVWNLN